MHKSVPKVPKVLTFGKVSLKIPKDPKFWGGVRPVLDEVQIKAAFFFGKLPKKPGHCPGRTKQARLGQARLGQVRQG